jgi:hypothetical protein
MTAGHDGPEAPALPGPAELWQQSEGDRERFRDLLRQYGHVLRPDDEGLAGPPAVRPSGWRPGCEGVQQAPESAQYETQHRGAER